MSFQTTVFYDGGCPLCRREVQHYQRIDRGCAVRWIDIDAQDTRLEHFGLTRDTAMARFHVQDREGDMQTGAAAFVALWRVLPYYRRLAGLLRSLRLVPLLEYVYEPFARWRLARRRNNCPV
jgi:predicted DCC family thiol-disulfide oxidoreductase YuxK